MIPHMPPPLVRQLAARSPALDPDCVPDWTDVGRGGHVVPRCAVEIIDVHDGCPLLFTARTPASALVLCYCPGWDEDGGAYLVAPASAESMADLHGGRLSLRDAVTTPWLALLWVSWCNDEVQSASVIRPEDVPDEYLPEAGVTLRMGEWVRP